MISVPRIFNTLVWSMVLLAGNSSLWSQGRRPELAPAPFLSQKAPQFHFRCVEDDAGGFYLVWTEPQSAQKWGLRLLRFNPAGPVWSSTGVPVAAGIDNPSGWTAFSDGKGGVALTWVAGGQARAQRFSSEGNPAWGQPSVLLSTVAARHPAGVADASGGAFIVWSEKAFSDRWVLMAQHLRSNGAIEWPAGTRVSRRPSDQDNPRVVYDNLSGAIVAWRDFRENASQLQVQRLDFSRNLLWGEQGFLITAPVGKKETPLMEALGSGDAVVAWLGSVGGVKRVFLDRIGPDPFLKWGDKIRSLSSNNQANRWNPVLHSDGKGGTWVAWEDDRNQNNWQIQLNRILPDGSPAWPDAELSVALASGDQGQVALADDGSGGVWAAWVDNRAADLGIYVQQVGADRRLHQGSSGRRIAAGLTKPSRPQMVPLGGGSVALAWADKTGRNLWDIHWTVVRP